MSFGITICEYLFHLTGALFGGHVRAVFFLITIIFIVCVTATITSFKEIPLNEINESDDYKKLNDDQFEEHFKEGGDVEKNTLKKDNASYGSLNQPDPPVPIVPTGEDDINVGIPIIILSFGRICVCVFVQE